MSNIQLHNDDCLKVISTIEDNSIDLIVTSPPYNRKRNDKYTDYNDNIDNYFSFLVNITDILLQKTKKYIFMNIQANYYNRVDI